MQGAIRDFEIIRIGYSIPMEFISLNSDDDYRHSTFNFCNIKYMVGNTDYGLPISQNLLDFPKTEEINIWDLKKILEKADL